MWHVSRINIYMTRRPQCLYIAATPDTVTFTKPVDFKNRSLPFVCAKSQNIARLHEIAKITTRKISAIPKSQNFVLANNSNKKVNVRRCSLTENLKMSSAMSFSKGVKEKGTS